MAVTPVRPPSGMSPCRRWQIHPNDVFNLGEAGSPLVDLQRMEVFAETSVLSGHDRRLPLVPHRQQSCMVVGTHRPPRTVRAPQTVVLRHLRTRRCSNATRWRLACYVPGSQFAPYPAYFVRLWCLNGLEKPFRRVQRAFRICCRKLHLMRPPVAPLAQFGDAASFDAAQRLPEDLSPCRLHDLEQGENVPTVNRRLLQFRIIHQATQPVRWDFPDNERRKALAQQCYGGVDTLLIGRHLFAKLARCPRAWERTRGSADCLAQE